MIDAGGAPLARDLGPVRHRTVRDGAAYEAGVVPHALRRTVLEELADLPPQALENSQTVNPTSFGGLEAPASTAGKVGAD